MKQINVNLSIVKFYLFITAKFEHNKRELKQK